MKHLWLMIVAVALQSCVWTGCGAPLYPKTLIQIDPTTGKIMRSSEMETALVIGAIDAGVNPDGTKFMRVGTTSQPAFVYGEEAVGVMKEYGEQQKNYVAILKQLGDNAVNSINAVGDMAGKVLGGLAGLRQFAVTQGNTEACAMVDQLTRDMNALVAKYQAAQSLVESMQTAAK